jgi:hypothetical protein
VSGVRFQAGSHFFTTDTLYETTPKWHSFLMNKLAAFQASGSARMRLRLAGTVNRLNVEHRTSNIDDATLYLFLKQASRSLRRALRQAQGLSPSKAAESNFEG